MKNSEKLRMLDALDEKYLEEANEDIRFRSKTPMWVKGLSVAACAALVLSLSLAPLFLQGNDSMEKADGYSTSNSETLWFWDAENGFFSNVDQAGLEYIAAEGNTGTPESVTTSDNKYSLFGDLYPTVADGAYAQYGYYLGRVELKYIEEKLGETTLMLNPDKQISCKAEVYRIKGIDPQYVVAVKADTASPYVQGGKLEGYLLFYRKDPHFESFSALAEAYDLKNQMYTGKVSVQGLMTGTGVIQNIIYPSEENRLFCEKLLQIDGKAVDVTLPKTDRSIGIDCGFLVTSGAFGIQIFEGGYLATNIGGKLHIFDIGKEAAAMLIEEGMALSPSTGGITTIYGEEEDPMPSTTETSGGYIPEETTGEDPYAIEPIGT